MFVLRTQRPFDVTWLHFVPNYPACTLYVPNHVIRWLDGPVPSGSHVPLVSTSAFCIRKCQYESHMPYSVLSKPIVPELLSDKTAWRLFHYNVRTKQNMVKSRSSGAPLHSITSQHHKDAKEHITYRSLSPRQPANRKFYKLITAVYSSQNKTRICRCCQVSTKIWTRKTTQPTKTTTQTNTPYPIHGTNVVYPLPNCAPRPIYRLGKRPFHTSQRCHELQWVYLAVAHKDHGLGCLWTLRCFEVKWFGNHRLHYIR